MEDGRFFRSVLLDFYGNMLTDKQRECFVLHYNEDFSLAEIAEQCGISRQGVWDNIRRAEEALQEFEDKTGLAARFLKREKCLDNLKSQLIKLSGITEGQALATVREALEQIDALERGE